MLSGTACSAKAALGNWRRGESVERHADSNASAGVTPMVAENVEMFGADTNW